MQPLFRTQINHESFNTRQLQNKQNFSPPLAFSKWCWKLPCKSNVSFCKNPFSTLPTNAFSDCEKATIESWQIEVDQQFSGVLVFREHFFCRFHFARRFWNQTYFFSCLIIIIQQILKTKENIQFLSRLTKTN